MKYLEEGNGHVTSVQNILCKNEEWCVSPLLSLFDTTTVRKPEQLQKKITARVTSQFPLRAMMMRVQWGPPLRCKEEEFFGCKVNFLPVPFCYIQWVLTRISRWFTYFPWTKPRTLQPGHTVKRVKSKDAISLSLVAAADDVAVVIAKLTSRSEY